MDHEDDVRQVLARYDIPFDLAQVASLGGAGGYSGARFWKLEHGGRPLMLRRWPRENPEPRQLWFIHSVLQHVASHGFALVPLPVVLPDGATYVFHADYLWQLEPYMPGRGDGAMHPSPARLKNAMSALARFHQAAVDFPRREATSGPSHGMLERIERLERFKAGGLARLRSHIDTTYEPELATLAVDCCELARQVIPALAAEVAPLARVKMPIQPVIGDVWHDNVLFDGDAVSGIIDFGAMRLDNITRDIARLLGGLAGDDRDLRQQGLAAYEAIRPLFPTEHQFVTMFDRCNVALSGLNWATWIYDEHREFDDLAAVRGRLEHFVGRLRRQL